MILYIIVSTFLVCLSFPENICGFPKVGSPDTFRNGTGLALGSLRGRAYFPFVVVNFPAEPCSSQNSNNNEGVCLSKKRCSSSGGDSIGSCQQGLGTCCKFTRQCTANSRSVSVVETVENLMRGTVTGICEYVFPKQHGICQVKLEFMDLVLSIPTPDGNCQTDSLTVGGSANLDGPLRVCGDLTGQHMILSYGATSDVFSVAVMSGTNYGIRATQIPCNSAYRAPDDCLQYYTSQTDVVRSFGFPIQLNNQEYNICVKPTSGGNTLTWTECTNAGVNASPFNISHQGISTTGVDCTTDWIVINDQRKCGLGFNRLQTSIGSHKRIHVQFDENETGEDVFYMVNPGTLPPTPTSCMDIKILPPIIPGVPPVPGQQTFCDYPGTGSLCRCVFSNAANEFAQAIEIKVVAGPPPTPPYSCLDIPGFITHTAIAEECMTSTGNSCCTYFNNIRITEEGNTGFCLKYQAM